tara:strand:- start:497 stop:880 length:384 start_codon:yes stop_codon:yes gene_type:complete
MAHPSEQMPKNTYLISATTTDVSAGPKNADHFFAITCTISGTVKVKGGGVYQYVDISEATNVHQNFIDPDTGVAFVNDATMNSAGDGFYQRIDSVETDIAMIAGQTVYGRFASVKSDGTFTGFAYAG